MPLRDVPNAEFDQLRLEIEADVKALPPGDHSLHGRLLMLAQMQCTFARAWGALADAFGSFPAVNVQRSDEERKAGRKAATEAYQALAAQGNTAAARILRERGRQ